MFTYRLDDESYLKLLDNDVLGELYRLIDSNRLHLRPWFPWVDEVRSEPDARMFILAAKKQYAENNGFRTAIMHRGELAGLAGYHEIDWVDRKTELGGWLGQSFEGSGLMTKTCRALVDHAFRQWRLHRVEILCGTENPRSCAVPERLGFTKEGTMREAECVNGTFSSHHVYGLLRREWMGEDA
ncbi:MAG TPA: GNAT family protein [Bacillales bacterium]|nr:GNAT family protein [Bacillales bacterium]